MEDTLDEIVLKKPFSIFKLVNTNEVNIWHGMKMLQLYKDKWTIKH